MEYTTETYHSSGKRDDKPSKLGVPYFHMNIIGENYRTKKNNNQQANRVQGYQETKGSPTGSNMLACLAPR
jgi:hypothetical protein